MGTIITPLLIVVLILFSIVIINLFKQSKRAHLFKDKLQKKFYPIKKKQNKQVIVLESTEYFQHNSTKKQALKIKFNKPEIIVLPDLANIDGILIYYHSSTTAKKWQPYENNVEVLMLKIMIEGESDEIINAKKSTITDLITSMLDKYNGVILEESSQEENCIFYIKMQDGINKKQLQKFLTKHRLKHNSGVFTRFNKKNVLYRVLDEENNAFTDNKDYSTFKIECYYGNLRSVIDDIFDLYESFAKNYNARMLTNDKQLISAEIYNMLISKCI